MRPDDLVVGESYFMVTYPEPDLAIPIVITYRYLGANLGSEGEPGGGTQYYFRYLPAFQLEEDLAASGWREMFPDLFAGWGESAPTSFDREKLAGFCTLDGLVAELSSIRDRLQRKP